MKIVRAFLSIAVAVVVVIGGVYVYRSCGALSCSGSLVAYADTADDGVLMDLQKDPNFKISDYPYIENDKSLQVIQIAENATGSLYVYVYHPGGFDDHKVLALHINMCTTYIENKPASNNPYALQPDKGEKTIYRYTVDGFTVKGDFVRHYDIASITRSFIAGVDEELGGDNTITEKAYPVGQAWTITGFGDAVEYAMVVQDVVEVTSKYVAFNAYCNINTISHFIAFSVDRQIDYLYEIEIEYTKQEITTETDPHRQLVFMGSIRNKGAQIDTVDIINADHKESVVTPNGNETVYRWDSIVRSDVFCTEEAQRISNNYSWANSGYSADKVKENDFVVRFFSCGYTLLPGDGVSTLYGGAVWTRVLDTVILRLKFETAGVWFNLGVVDDVQSGKQPDDGFIIGNSGPGCDSDLFADLWYWIKRIWSFMQEHWEFFLIGFIVVVVGAVVVTVLEWGFKQKK